MLAAQTSIATAEPAQPDVSSNVLKLASEISGEQDCLSSDLDWEKAPFEKKRS
jgi:hypothetical protein